MKTYLLRSGNRRFYPTPETTTAALACVGAEEEKGPNARPTFSVVWEIWVLPLRAPRAQPKKVKRFSGCYKTINRATRVGQPRLRPARDSRVSPALQRWEKAKLEFPEPRGGGRCLVVTAGTIYQL